MFEIRFEDVDYAMKELVRESVPLWGEYDWEAEIKKNSQSFWKLLTIKIADAGKTKVGNDDLEIDSANPTEEMLKAAMEMQNLRLLLTIAFATVYSAYGKALPKLSDEKVMASMESYVQALEMGNPEEEVIRRMKELQPLWGETFETEINDYHYQLHAFSQYILFVMVKSLLDELPADAKKTSGKEIMLCQVAKPGTRIDRHVENKPPVEAETDTGISFDQIGGQTIAKSKVMKLAAALNNPERYQRWGTKPPRGICLFGPTGNGKTLLAKALSTSANVPFYNVNSSDLMSMWYGQSEKNVDAIFKKARETTGIIFFDEADALASSRATPGAHEASNRVVASLNRNMDGFETSDRVVVFFATNRPEDMDEAVLRPGRIDYMIEVPLPDKDGRRQVFGIHTKKAEKIAGRKLFEELDIELFLEKTENFSGADIAEIVRRTLETKVGKEDIGGEPGLVTTDDILAELKGYERVRETRKKMGFVLDDK